jgi:Flp pilus assembly protein TadD
MSDGVEALMERYSQAMERGERQAAAEALEEVLTVEPDHLPALGAMGALLGADGQHEIALALYDRAITIAPELAAAHYSRGLELQRLGRPDEAVEAYTRAIELDPTDPDPLINRGRLLDDDDEPEAAIVDYDRALSLDDTETIAWCNRGNSLMSLERFEEAIASFDRALAVDPDDVAARLGRSSSLMSMGRVDEADAARPVRTPQDRGPVRQLRRSLGDAIDLVARWYPGNHQNPEWLEAAAESLLEAVAGAQSRAGDRLNDGVTMGYGWSLLTVRWQGDDRVLCEPDFSRHPLTRITYDISFTLQTLVMQDLMLSIVETSPTECGCMDLIAVQHGHLTRPRLKLTRVSSTKEGFSGWVAGPESRDAIAQMLRDEDYDMIPTAMLVQARPHLVKVLLLPEGFDVTFDGHAVTSVVDDQGRERFAT